jgi:hypothetical protein
MHSIGFVVGTPQFWHSRLLIEIPITRNEHVKIQADAEADACASALQHLAAALLQR